MKTFLIGLIVGSIIGGMWVQFRFTNDIWSNKPKEELCPKIVEPIEYCYFQSTFGDVVKEEKLNCDRYKDYPFNTIHWNSLPHGFIK